MTIILKQFTFNVIQGIKNHNVIFIDLPEYKKEVHKEIT